MKRFYPKQALHRFEGSLFRGSVCHHFPPKIFKQPSFSPSRYHYHVFFFSMTFFSTNLHTFQIFVLCKSSLYFISQNFSFQTKFRKKATHFFFGKLLITGIYTERFRPYYKVCYQYTIGISTRMGLRVVYVCFCSVFFLQYRL